MSDEHKSPAQADAWQQLRSLTPARIALGHAGISLPTAAQLDFQFAHAQARDAVHLPFDHAALTQQLAGRQRQTLTVHSSAPDRNVYLQRPDLGRKLSVESAEQLRRYADKHPQGFDLAVVVADGLSSLAVQRHGPPMLERIDELAAAEGWSVTPVTLVQQGRVAVADEVAQLLGARMVVILIGERPGLSSPDSLGLYFTYAPRVGLNDAARNCISNVRLEGMSYAMAAHKLSYLMREAWQRQISGVRLKDDAQVPVLEAEADIRPGNFLIDG